MTTSAPRSRTSCSLAPLAVVATWAPRCLASWMTVDPSPPVPAWTRISLPGLDVCLLDQDLPGRQRDQRDRCGLLQRQGGRLERDVIFVDGDVLREGPDAKVAGACEHFVADREAADVGSNLGDHTGHVVAEHERWLVLEELFELAVADHAVQRVDTRCAHLDEDVPITDPRLGHVGGADLVLAVPSDDECLHVVFPFIRVGPHPGQRQSASASPCGIGRLVLRLRRPMVVDSMAAILPERDWCCASEGFVTTALHPDRPGRGTDGGRSQSRSSCAFEDAGCEYVVGQFPVGDRACELQGRDEDREQPQRAGARGGGVLWRQVRRDHVDDGLHALGVGIADGVAAAADLIEQRSVGTASARIVAMMRRRGSRARIPPAPPCPRVARRGRRAG